MKWCIYKHTNKKNGKSYIGLTHQKLEKRWGYQGKGYQKSQKLFYKAIKKYGWDNFTHEILEDNIPTLEKANEREIYYIKLYRTYIGFEDCKGYNMTLGGDTNEHLGLPVYQIDMKTLKIINEFSSIRTAELETNIERTAIVYCCKNKKCSITAGGYYWCFKSNYTKEWKPREKKYKFNSIFKAEVYQINMNDLKIINKFESLSEASKTIKKPISNIHACCKRKKRSCGGYFWCYANEYTSEWEPIEDKNDSRLKKCYRISMTNFKDIVLYNTLAEAAKKNNLTMPKICQCCRRNQISAGGFHWAYEEDYNENWRPIEHGKKVKVMCIETNEIFDSIALAEKKYIHAVRISECCSGTTKTSGGYHWKKIELK